MSRRHAAKWQWALVRATAHACLAIAILFSAATVISAVALALGLQEVHPPVRHLSLQASWYSVLLSNLVVAGFSYVSGLARSRAFYFGLLGFNILVWAVVLSQIIPWMQTSHDWAMCAWLDGYISAEIYAYTLANAVGMCRLVWYPVPTLLALAAFTEVAGMQHFLR